MWSKLKIVAIQWIESRIWDMIEDWYINNLAKNRVSADFHLRITCRSVSPKFIELCMETPCLCPSEGHKYGGCIKGNRNICPWVLLLRQNIITQEPRHIKRNVSSSARTLHLAKTKVITHPSTYATAFLDRNFNVTQPKRLEIQTCYYNKNSVKLKQCETSSSCRVFYLMKRKPEMKRYYLILENDYITWKLRIQNI